MLPAGFQGLNQKKIFSYFLIHVHVDELGFTIQKKTTRKFADVELHAVKFLFYNAPI